MASHLNSGKRLARRGGGAPLPGAEWAADVMHTLSLQVAFSVRRPSTYPPGTRQQSHDKASKGELPTWELLLKHFHCAVHVT